MFKKFVSILLTYSIFTLSFSPTNALANSDVNSIKDIERFNRRFDFTRSIVDKALNKYSERRLKWGTRRYVNKLIKNYPETMKLIGVSHDNDARTNLENLFSDYSKEILTSMIVDNKLYVAEDEIYNKVFEQKLSGEEISSFATPQNIISDILFIILFVPLLFVLMIFDCLFNWGNNDEYFDLCPLDDNV